MRSERSLRLPPRTSPFCRHRLLVVDRGSARTTRGMEEPAVLDRLPGERPAVPRHVVRWRRDIDQFVGDARRAGRQRRRLGFRPSRRPDAISVYAMRMAAVFPCRSALFLRTSAIPRWVLYLGYAVALILLIASGERDLIPLLFPAWVLLLTVVILLSRRPTELGKLAPAVRKVDRSLGRRPSPARCWRKPTTEGAAVPLVLAARASSAAARASEDAEASIRAPSTVDRIGRRGRDGEAAHQQCQAGRSDTGDQAAAPHAHSIRG